MKPLFFPLVLNTFLLATLPVRAQNALSALIPAPAPAFSAPASGAPVAVGPNFRLQAGDVLAVQVANHPEMSAAAVAVAGNGKLNLPVVGALAAAGRTLGEVTARITMAYTTQLKRPQVAVTLVSTVPRQLTIRGAVGRPGPLEARGDLRLSEAIVSSGGLVADGTTLTGDEVNATLVRGTGARPLDLQDALTSPQSGANIPLHAGDIINIEPLPLVVVALAGDGVTPGTVKIRLSKSRGRLGFRVSDALRLGGSLKAKPAQTRGALVRAGKKTDLNVPALFDASAPEADLPIRDGDLLTFDVVEVKKIDVSVVSLDGSVKTPGNFSFDNEASALRTLVQAGGFASDTAPDQVSVTVQRGGTSIPVDVARAALDPKFDVPLQSKDVIFAAYNPSPRVRVIGSVTKPDAYRLKANASVLDAITTAGGLTLPPAQSSIRIARTQKDGKQISINVDAAHLIGMADASQNVRLQDGDLIFVGESRRGRQVYIAGEVAAPSAVDLGEGDGLAELLLKAGGPKSSAALSKLSITSRGGAQRFVDGSPLGRGEKIQVPLEEGDFVNVPRNEARVVVWGAVNKPDNYTIPENRSLTLGDALALAGGPSGNAKLKDVAVIHRAPAGTTAAKTEILPLSNDAKGAQSVNYVLQNGDVVFVPQTRVTQSALSQFGSVFGALGLFLR